MENNEELCMSWRQLRVIYICMSLFFLNILRNFGVFLNLFYFYNEI